MCSHSVVYWESRQFPQKHFTSNLIMQLTRLYSICLHICGTCSSPVSLVPRPSRIISAGAGNVKAPGYELITYIYTTTCIGGPNV